MRRGRGRLDVVPALGVMVGDAVALLPCEDGVALGVCSGAVVASAVGAGAAGVDNRADVDVGVGVDVGLQSGTLGVGVFGAGAAAGNGASASAAVGGHSLVINNTINLNGGTFTDRKSIDDLAERVRRLQSDSDYHCAG